MDWSPSCNGILVGEAHLAWRRMRTDIVTGPFDVGEQILYFKYLYCQEARVAFCKRMLRVRIVEFAWQDSAAVGRGPDLCGQPARAAQSPLQYPEFLFIPFLERPQSVRSHSWS